MSHKEHLPFNFDPLGHLSYQQRRSLMKWLITIITAALTTTGCMLETPDPCDSSPIACDSAPVIKEPVPDTPRMDATPGVESISVSWSGSTRAEAYFLYHNTSSPVGTANRIDLADVSSYQFKDLDPSKKYYFSVVGYNKTGPSSISSEASATPVPRHRRLSPRQREQAPTASAGPVPEELRVVIPSTTAPALR